MENKYRVAFQYSSLNRNFFGQTGQLYLVITAKTLQDAEKKFSYFVKGNKNISKQYKETYQVRSVIFELII